MSECTLSAFDLPCKLYSCQISIKGRAQCCASFHCVLIVRERERERVFNQLKVPSFVIHVCTICNDELNHQSRTDNLKKLDIFCAVMLNKTLITFFES